LQDTIARRTIRLCMISRSAAFVAEFICVSTGAITPIHEGSTDAAPEYRLQVGFISAL
jgi:hypothetical protein